MRIRTGFAILGLLVLAGVRLAGAQVTIDKPTFTCETKSSAAGQKWGSARGACISKCQLAFWKEHQDPVTKVSVKLGKCSGSPINNFCCADSDCPGGQTCSVSSSVRCCYDNSHDPLCTGPNGRCTGVTCPNGGPDACCCNGNNPANPPPVTCCDDTIVHFDTTTKECVDKIDEKYTGAVVKSCPDAAYPNCVPYMTDGVCTGDTTLSCNINDQDCPTSPSNLGPCIQSTPHALAHALGTVQGQAPLVDKATVPLFMCDDGTQAKCESAAVKNLAKLAGAVSKCVAKCESNVFSHGGVCGKDSNGMPVNCQCKTHCVGQIGNPYTNLDVVTKACTDKVIQKTIDKITKACPSAPGCSGFETNPSVGVQFVLASVGDASAQPTCCDDAFSSPQPCPGSSMPKASGDSFCGINP